MSEPHNHVSADSDRLCIVAADLAVLRTAVQEACDLLAERAYGNGARSPGHNARLVLERGLKMAPEPSVKRIPDDAQPAQVTDDELYRLAVDAWESQTSYSWYPDAMDAVVLAIRERLASQPSPAATVDPLHDSRNPNHGRSGGLRDPAHNGSSAGSARQVRPELNLLTIGNTSMADKSAGTTDAGCGAAVITPWAVDNEPGRDFSLGLKSLSGLRTLTPEQSDFLHDAAEEFERLRDLPQQVEVWQPVETAPHETRVILGWWAALGDKWECETGYASHGWQRNGISTMSRHGQATHWQPLPSPLPRPLSRTGEA